MSVEKIKMNNLVSSFVVATTTTLAFSFSLSANAFNVTGITFNGNVINIDSQTGDGNPVGSSGFERLNSLAVDSSGRLITATAPWPIEPNTPSTLVQIDSLTGQGTAIATVSGLVNGIDSMAFSPNNELFAYSRASGGTVQGNRGLFKIDVLTGQTTFIGSTGGPFFIQGLTFDSNGTLYGWSGDGGSVGGLYTIDPNTGIATDVNSSVAENGVDIQTLSFGPDGKLYGGRLNLYTIDTTTGIPTLIGGDFIGDVRGIAFTEPVPEPITILGSGIALTFGTLLKRKLGKTKDEN